MSIVFLLFDDAKVEIISFPPNKTLLFYSNKYHFISITMPKRKIYHNLILAIYKKMGIRMPLITLFPFFYRYNF